MTGVIYGPGVYPLKIHCIQFLPFLYCSRLFNLSIFNIVSQLVFRFTPSDCSLISFSTILINMFYCSLQLFFFLSLKFYSSISFSLVIGINSIFSYTIVLILLYTGSVLLALFCLFFVIMQFLDLFVF